MISRRKNNKRMSGRRKRTSVRRKRTSVRRRRTSVRRRRTSGRRKFGDDVIEIDTDNDRKVVFVGNNGEKFYDRDENGLMYNEDDNIDIKRLKYNIKTNIRNFPKNSKNKLKKIEKIVKEGSDYIMAALNVYGGPFKPDPSSTSSLPFQENKSKLKHLFDYTNSLLKLSSKAIDYA